MYDRILVPLDGSSFSEEMIPYAEGLAGVHGTILTLLRIVANESERDEATRYVEHLAVAHGARGLCVVANGDVADAILQVITRPDSPARVPVGEEAVLGDAWKRELAPLAFENKIRSFFGLAD